MNTLLRFSLFALSLILLKCNGPELLWSHTWPLFLFIAVVLDVGLKTFRRTLD